MEPVIPPQLVCPRCKSVHRQVKIGFNRSGERRYRCQHCKCSYQLRPSRRGYSDELRQQALRLYLEQNGFRRTGRILGINAQTVANWIAAEEARQPAAMQPPEAEIVEMDELYAAHQKKGNFSSQLLPLTALRAACSPFVSVRHSVGRRRKGCWMPAYRLHAATQMDALPMLD